MDSPINFSVNEDCIKCSTCMKVYPRANIYYHNSKSIIFGNHYKCCLSCVNNCPKKSLQVKKG